MKKTKKKRSTGVRELVSSGPVDWAPLLESLQDAFEWALDVAVGLARGYPEEIEAVERVRAYIRARIAGEPATLVVDDALFTFALIIGAIGRELDAVGELASWMEMQPLRLPGADEPWDPTWLPRLVYTLNHMGAHLRASA